MNLGGQNEPSDLVEVVRCKDCRYGRPSIEGDRIVCHGEYHSKTWYCPLGKERGNENENQEILQEIRRVDR